MPPLPALGGARGRRLMRVYATALGYAAGHCHITAVGDPYTRLAAGWTGIVTSGLVLLALLFIHAQAERETSHETKARLMNEIGEIIDPESASRSRASSPATTTRTAPAPHQ